MMNKMTFLAGVAAGYVLGARAGQQRYDQIKTQANKVWTSEPVQQKVGQATDAVKEKAPVVGDKVGGAVKSAGSSAKSAAGSAKDKVSGGEDLPETVHRGDDGELHADTSGFGPGGEKLP